MYQTEALPEQFEASVGRSKKRLFSERIAEHFQTADNSLGDSLLSILQKEGPERYAELL